MRHAPQPEKSPAPIHAMARLDGDALVVSLTDGRGLFRDARGPFDAPLLRRLSDLARDGHRAGPAFAAATSLYAWLFPGDCGKLLQQLPPRELNLQLAPALDELLWECASDGSAFLGHKFCVTRHLASDEPDAAEPLRPDEHRVSPLVLALPDGMAGPVPGGARVRIERLPDPFEGDPLVRLRWRDADVLCLAECWRGHPPQVLALADWPERARVVVAEAGLGSAHHAWVQATRALGWAFVAVWPGEPSWTPELVALVEPLAEGLPVGEALRQQRAGKRSREALVSARLYGDGRLRLAGRRAAAAQADGIRQVASLSFDVVDSTVALRVLGKERYAELLPSLHERCSAIVREYGGVSDLPQGSDGFMNYFGHPMASEDAVAQAVRAGLAIAALAHPPFAVRVGVATGDVSVRAGQPFGEDIHLADRLQKVSAPGSLSVCATTARLVGHLFELQRFVPQVEMKGVAEVDRVAYRVVRERSATHRHRLDALPQLTPFVGRDDELRTLERLWQQARQGRLQVVCLTGEAGMGKSRLVREFRHRLRAEGGDSLECRCLPEGMTSAFHAVAGALRHQLGLDDRDTAAVALSKIRRHLPADLGDEETVPLMAALLGVPQPTGASPSANPGRQRERTLALMVDWFCRVAGGRPLCLVVEDAHWIDPSSREFILRLADSASAAPLMVVITQRDEGESRFVPAAGWESLNLRGLAPGLSRDLLRQACGETALPPRVLGVLAARADGVPLFLEEAARMALELSAADAGDDGDVLDSKVPVTLQGLLTARLDRQGDAKTVAQLGAVLGREFPLSLLELVVEQEGVPLRVNDLASHLSMLERSGLLLRSDVSGETRYAFKHALVRDTAYQTLWMRDRQQLHRIVAQVMPVHLPDLAAHRPELLARHQSEAGLHTAAMAQWELAARAAASRSAHSESLKHLHSALRSIDHLRPGPERDRIELRLQLLLASRYIATEGYGAEQVERVYTAAARLCQTLGDLAAGLKVELGLEGYHFMRGDFEAAQQFAQRAIDMAAGSADVMQRLQAQWAMANVLFHRGEISIAVSRMDDCLGEYRSSLHRPGAVQDPGVMCLCYSAWGQWELGRADDALERIHRVQALARTLGHRFSQAEASAFAASVHHFRGETEAALAHAEHCVALCEEHGFAVWLAHARVMRGRLWCEQGRVDEGVAEMVEGHALWQRTGAVVTQPFYLALLAEGHALARQPERGLARLREALAIAQRTGERYYEAELRRLMGELTLQRDPARSGDTLAEAEHWLLGAYDLAMQQRTLGLALRSATGLARLWVQQGRSAEAASVLRPLLEGLNEGHGTRDLKRARNLLAELAGHAEHGEG